MTKNRFNCTHTLSVFLKGKPKIKEHFGASVLWFSSWHRTFGSLNSAALNENSPALPVAGQLSMAVVVAFPELVLAVEVCRGPGWTMTMFWSAENTQQRRHDWSFCEWKCGNERRRQFTQHLVEWDWKTNVENSWGNPTAICPREPLEIEGKLQRRAVGGSLQRTFLETKWICHLTTWIGK